MICIPIAAKTNAGARNLLARAESEPADLHELRLDAIEGRPDVEGLIAASGRPVLATCRSAEQGGGFAGTRAERLAILQRAVDFGASYIDCEEDVVSAVRRKSGVVLIASRHDFSAVPDNLRRLADRLAATPCDWVKFAAAAADAGDNPRILEAVKTCKKPAIGIAMGEAGLASRVLGLAYGSKIAFGALSTGLESAPGQPTARELKDFYRVKDLTADTAVYGLIGDPVAHSLGRMIHNRAFAEAGVDAVYIPFRCSRAREFLETVPSRLGIRGLSVTMPHKRAALEWADLATGAADAVGAANTLSLRKEGWLADNSDYPAARDALAAAALSHGLDPRGKAALVLGAGGAARAVGAALAELGCATHVAARDGDKARLLAGASGWTATAWRDRDRGKWAVVANATPIGMTPDEDAAPFPAGAWRPGVIAFESVYRPRETRFLREAKAAGAIAVDGLELFFRQAALQYESWLGAPPPRCYDPADEYAQALLSTRPT